MASAKDKAQKIINDNPVAVFSKSYCPYCKASKALLKEKSINPYVYELDLEPDGDDLQSALLEITGQKTVPNIFIGKKHIGGNSDLQAIKNEVKGMVEAAM